MTGAPRVLVFGIGNPARRDDALGVLLVERIRQYYPSIKVVEEFQLQIENALDLRGADLVLFCDAAVGLAHSCKFSEIEPVASKLAFSHAMPPQALLEVYARIQGVAPPPAFALGLRAVSMELGEGLSAEGAEALEDGWTLATRLFGTPCLEAWRRQAQEGFNWI